MFILFKQKFGYVKKALWLAVIVCLFCKVSIANAENLKISEIKVIGNHAVQSEAIIGVLSSKVGGNLNPQDIKNDIKAIYRSGFFQDVSIEKEPASEPDSVILIIRVEEKPIIADIKFEGFREVTSSSITEKLQSKKYAIVDDKKISADIRTIEQMYIDKGYYLARVQHDISVLSSGEAYLIFKVTENNPISIGRISILGNTYFSDSDLKQGLMTTEKRWTSWITKSGMFRDEFISRDKEFLAYFYQDNGFVDADIATPHSRLNDTRQTIDVTFSLEEGLQYSVGKISFSGDLIFKEGELKEKLQLKENDIYRYSRFQNDLKKLSDLYGDEGFAFVYVVPKITKNRELRKVDLEWAITKGEKAYFRKISIEGNVKTRDNVIRRNIKVAEGDLFNSTKLDKSKEAIERLGFFENVTVQQIPDAKNNAIDLAVKIKEKSTGNLSAQLGASPSPSGPLTFQAQGTYSEANFLGRGWNTSATGSVSRSSDTSSPSWGLTLQFEEPSLFDGPWSIAPYFSFKYEYSKVLPKAPELASKKREIGLSIGREIFEDLRLSIGYGFEKVKTDNYNLIYKFITEMGNTEKITETLQYNKTNNYMMPTAGYSLSLTARQALSLFGSDFWYSKLELSAVYYLPINFTPEFQTNFRFAFEPGFIAPLKGHRIPVWDRYSLGNQYNMKAYQNNRIEPYRQVPFSPWVAGTQSLPIGGVTRYYGAAEYFVPLIPEANLRFVTFAETGNILDDNEKFALKNFKFDFGIGIRWTTPIAPFRFEWAWPVEKRKIGQGEFVLGIGLDNAASF